MEPNPADLVDWAVIGFSDAAVGVIDNILLEQTSHKHWKPEGFVAKTEEHHESKVVLPRVDAGKRLKPGQEAVEVSDDRHDGADLHLFDGLIHRE